MSTGLPVLELAESEEEKRRRCKKQGVGCGIPKKPTATLKPAELKRHRVGERKGDARRRGGHTEKSGHTIETRKSKRYHVEVGEGVQ